MPLSFSPAKLELAKRCLRECFIANSRRSKGPFVALNCAAVSERVFSKVGCSDTFEEHLRML